MKPFRWIVLGLVGVLVVAGAVAGKNYYDNRYVGSTYYAMVPLDYDMTETPVRAMDGREVGTGVEYRLTAYSDAGETKSVWFTVYDPSSSISRGEVPPQPGTYLKITASKTTVIGWSVTSADAVPTTALAAIQAA